MAVGVGNAINDAELLEIALGNRKLVLHAKDFTDLETHIDQIHDSTCAEDSSELFLSSLQNSLAGYVELSGRSDQSVLK